MEDRYPLLSQYIYNGSASDDSQYETILTQDGSSNCRILSQADKYNPNNNNQDFQYETTWDGFTITGGTLSEKATRSGGGGARIFKNVSLKNCVIYKIAIVQQITNNGLMLEAVVFIVMKVA